MSILQASKNQLIYVKTPYLYGIMLVCITGLRYNPYSYNPKNWVTKKAQELAPVLSHFYKRYL